MHEKIWKILMNYSEKSEDEIKPESNLQTDLGLNSLDVIGIVTDFEDQFGISIPDEDILTLTTVKDIEEYIQKKQGAYRHSVRQRSRCSA